MMTQHAAIRAQQRCIPPLIDQWLDQFGEELHDGHGAIRRYFSKTSIRAMEKACGREPIAMLARYLNTYKVVNSETNCVITIGHHTKRFKKP